MLVPLLLFSADVSLFQGIILGVAGTIAVYRQMTRSRRARRRALLRIRQQSREGSKESSGGEEPVLMHHLEAQVQEAARTVLTALRAEENLTRQKERLLTEQLARKRVGKRLQRRIDDLDERILQQKSLIKRSRFNSWRGVPVRAQKPFHELRDMLLNMRDGKGNIAFLNNARLGVVRNNPQIYSTYFRIERAQLPFVKGDGIGVIFQTGGGIYLFPNVLLYYRKGASIGQFAVSALSRLSPRMDMCFMAESKTSRSVVYSEEELERIVGSNPSAWETRRMARISLTPWRHSLYLSNMEDAQNGQLKLLDFLHHAEIRTIDESPYIARDASLINPMLVVTLMQQGVLREESLAFRHRLSLSTSREILHLAERLGITQYDAGGSWVMAMRSPVKAIELLNHAILPLAKRSVSGEEGLDVFLGRIASEYYDGVLFYVNRLLRIAAFGAAHWAEVEERQFRLLCDLVLLMRLLRVNMSRLTLSCLPLLQMYFRIFHPRTLLTQERFGELLRDEEFLLVRLNEAVLPLEGSELRLEMLVSFFTAASAGNSILMDYTMSLLHLSDMLSRGEGMPDREAMESLEWLHYEARRIIPRELLVTLDQDVYSLALRSLDDVNRLMPDYPVCPLTRLAVNINTQLSERSQSPRAWRPFVLFVGPAGNGQLGKAQQLAFMFSQDVRFQLLNMLTIIDVSEVQGLSSEEIERLLLRGLGGTYYFMNLPDFGGEGREQLRSDATNVLVRFINREVHQESIIIAGAMPNLKYFIDEHIRQPVSVGGHLPFEPYSLTRARSEFERLAYRAEVSVDSEVLVHVEQLFYAAHRSDGAEFLGDSFLESLFVTSLRNMAARVSSSASSGEGEFCPSIKLSDLPSRDE